MYIYDHDLQTRGQSLHHDDHAIKFLADKLREHNSWVKQYRSLLVEVHECDGENMCNSFEESFRVTPTARREIAVLLYKDNSKKSGTRHVYTFPRNGLSEE